MNIVSRYIRSMSCGGKTISGRNIADHLGISGIEVRRQVNAARSAGVPICSTSAGYYYSDDPENIRKTVDSLWRRIGAQEKAIEGLTALIP